MVIKFEPLIQLFIYREFLPKARKKLFNEMIGENMHKNSIQTFVQICPLATS